MRPFDELARLFSDPNPVVQRYALLHTESLRVTFEASEVVEFLSSAANRDDPDVRNQARRALRKIQPSYYAQKYNLRQATTTTKAGTWTEYNIGDFEAALLDLRLVQERIDGETSGPAQMLAAAIEGDLDRCEEALPPEWADGGTPPSE